ncbi:MAG TPA: 3-hydroxylacyl-ACP dehydratase [Usitatibacter sp.]|nr:3-hydroxylacyl-ACP dehydratase [Usitatibacter sp.]
MRAPLGREWLAANLPHQGSMSLLDEILAWDASSIEGLARRHRATDHPLRRNGILPVAAGIEYGAQLAAAHGALCEGAPSGPGLLASVRGVRFEASRLDDIEGALHVRAEQLGAGESGVVYRFEVASGGRLLVAGRLAVAFGA